MVGILKTIWLDLRSCLRAISRSSNEKTPEFPNFNVAVGGRSAGSTKRFYSLIIEVRPAEADAETLQLFSDDAGLALAATLNLPTGCELRRCTPVSPDFAEILINM